MNKKLLIIATAAILTIGTVIGVYAKETSNSNKFGSRQTMMYQANMNNNDAYSKMVDLMRNNGFEGAAKAMESRDFHSMNNYMKNITDDQYNKMIAIMKNNGYEDMAKMMGSVNRQQMVNMHNSMMGR